MKPSSTGRIMTKTYSTWQIMRFAAKGKRMTFHAPNSENHYEAKADVSRDGCVVFYTRTEVDNNWKRYEYGVIDHRSDWTRVVKKKKPVTVKKEVERVEITGPLGNRSFDRFDVEVYEIAGKVALLSARQLIGAGWKVIAERDKE